MKEHFIQLFKYEKWATGKVLDAMKQLPEQDAKCVEWIAHIFMAQYIWYYRMAGIENKLTPWEKRNFTECLHCYAELNNLWDIYCTNLTEEDLHKTVHYKNTKGEPFHNVLKDILAHVINHSTYHRGQIIAQLKGKLPSLPSTDYIFFMR